MDLSFQLSETKVYNSLLFHPGRIPIWWPLDEILPIGILQKPPDSNMILNREDDFPRNIKHQKEQGNSQKHKSRRCFGRNSAKDKYRDSKTDHLCQKRQEHRDSPVLPFPPRGIIFLDNHCCFSNLLFALSL